MKIEYQGAFFKEKDLEKLRAFIERLPEGENGLLDTPVEHPHVTFKHNPTRLFPQAIVGQEAEFRVVGYANDGKNQGFEVEIADKALEREFYQGAEKVHITMSVAKKTHKAQAVDTRDLDFRPIEPFAVKGKLGYFTSDRKTVLEPAEKAEAKEESAKMGFKI